MSDNSERGVSSGLCSVLHVPFRWPGLLRGLKRLSGEVGGCAVLLRVGGLWCLRADTSGNRKHGPE